MSEDRECLRQSTSGLWVSRVKGGGVYWCLAIIGYSQFA